MNGIKWISDRGGCMAFELKMVKLKSLAFSSVPEHQEQALMKARGLTGVPLVHKISDSALGYLPFDCFTLYGAGAYLVIGYLRFDGLTVVAIKIEDWITEKYGYDGVLKRGSLSFERALELGSVLVGV